MQAIDLNNTQKQLVRLFQKYGPLSPDDCSTFLKRWTVSIRGDFEGLHNAGLIEIWCDGYEFAQTIYKLTAEGKGVAV